MKEDEVSCWKKGNRNERTSSSFTDTPSSDESMVGGPVEDGHHNIMIPLLSTTGAPARNYERPPARIYFFPPPHPAQVPTCPREH